MSSEMLHYIFVVIAYADYISVDKSNVFIWEKYLWNDQAMFHATAVDAFHNFSFSDICNFELDIHQSVMNVDLQTVYDLARFPENVYSLVPSTTSLYN